ncbi:vacuolar sorting protein 39 domain 2-domain-containing protein [Dipodascopsis tothii]|uniref:vacuolar sorting protein 39 domain 2-domain-containing protein n=1 Tax=Dipodascopsis tothii TaxID=44089 RepID=UPI0034CF4FB3
MSIESQVAELIRRSQFDDAITLIQSSAGDSFDADVRENQLRVVKALKAESLFDQNRFKLSMQLFSEISAAPERVLQLYPPSISGPKRDSNKRDQSTHQRSASAVLTSASLRRLISTQASDRRTVSSTTSDGLLSRTLDEIEDGFDGITLHNATIHLISYLTDTRRKLSRLRQINSGKLSQLDIEKLSELDLLSTDTYGPPELIERRAVLVDTALFRSYILVNPTIVGSLLRLPNCCDTDVVSSILRTRSRWTDLLDFYYWKSYHADALKLLRDLGESGKVPELSGPRPTVSYLQRLDNKHLEVILDFIKWPMSINEVYGEHVFLERSPQSESLSRDKVLKFLATETTSSRELAIKYLNHIIFTLGEQSPDFHNELAILYLEQLKHDGYNFAYDPRVQLSLDNLLEFLEKSTQYRPERLLGLLPRDLSLFWEPRAVLLSKIGEHKRALEIYVFNMKDYEKAQKYCADVFRKQHYQSLTEPSARADNEAKSVFHILLELYLRPPLQYSHGVGYESSLNLDAALSLLSTHGAHLSAKDALALLPSTIKVSTLYAFFYGHLRATFNDVARGRVSTSLRKAELVRTQENLLNVKNRSVMVEDTRVCPVCLKRLGNSVVAVFPNNAVVHYGCTRQYKDQIGGI